jgi:hypothetical protein
MKKKKIFALAGNGTSFPPRQFAVPTELSRLLPLIWIIFYYMICMHIYVLSELGTAFFHISYHQQWSLFTEKKICDIKEDT